MTSFVQTVPNDLGLTEAQLHALYTQEDEHVDSSSSTNAPTRDPRTGRIVGGIDGSDEKLNVTFTLEPMYHKALSVKNGAVTYVDVEHITISAPGFEQETLIHRPVREYDKWRFPLEYEAFAKGRAEPVTGTPLSLWPILTPSQVKSAELMGVRTVEQFAALSDTAGAKLGGFQALKKQAQGFLSASAEGAKTAELQEELANRDAQLHAMQAQMNKLMGMLEAQNAEKKSKSAPKSADQ